jgi:hypothetical protein
MKGFPVTQCGLFRSDGGFFHEHDGNFVAYWIDAAARLTLQATVVGNGSNRRFARRANEDVE